MVKVTKHVQCFMIHIRPTAVYAFIHGCILTLLYTLSSTEMLWCHTTNMRVIPFVHIFSTSARQHHLGQSLVSKSS